MVQYRLSESASLAFPTVARLRRGVLLGALVRVVATRPGGTPGESYIWHGHVLRLWDQGGTSGCIAFTPEWTVGAFLDVKSGRSPFGEDSATPYDAETYFAAAPPVVLDLARREVLPHLVDWLGDPAILDEAAARGTLEALPDALFAPVITAAFWGAGGRLAAGEPWPAVYRHGAHILRLELSDVERALAEWANGWELTAAEVDLIRRLYARRLATAGPTMRLTGAEYAELTGRGAAQLGPAGALLAAVGIALP